MGRLLLRHARSLDAGARDLDREIRLAKGLELGELRIGVGPWGGAALVAPVIGRLHSQHPKLRLRVVVAPWRELPARLRARDVDIVVGALGEIEPLEEFTTVALPDHEMVVVGRAGHPLTGTADVTVHDIINFPIVGPGMDSEAAEPAGRRGRPTRRLPPAAIAELLAIECDSSDVLKRLLVETDALTFMPRFVVDDDLHDGRLAIVAGVDLGLTRPLRRGMGSRTHTRRAPAPRSSTCCARNTTRSPAPPEDPNPKPDPDRLLPGPVTRRP